MVEIDPNKHPGLYRYSLELVEYPELTDEQYASVMADLRRPVDDPVHESAREKLICSHLGMVLSMAVNTSFHYYGLSMEDFVGIGNHALVERFSYFKPNRNARFAGYMRKVVERWVYGNLKAYIVWERDDGVDMEAVGWDYADAQFHECVEKVHNAVATLNREERRIVELLFFSSEQPRLASVAERLRRTPDGLKKSLNIIYEKLRPRLREVRFPTRRIIITPDLENEDE